MSDKRKNSLDALTAGLSGVSAKQADISDRPVIKDIVLRNNMAVITVMDEEMETVFRLLIDLYTQHGYYKDQELSLEQIKELTSLHAYSHGYSTVLRKLTTRDCSESEIREALDKQYNLTDRQKEQIIDEFKHNGFINDEELVRNYIEIAQDNLYGINRIRANLMKKGIERDVIDLQLEYTDAEEEINRAVTRLETLIRGPERKSHAEFIRSLQTKLITAGFSPSIAREAVEREGLQKDEEQEKANLEREYENAYRKYSRKYDGKELKEKILAALQRKGFGYGTVREYMNERGQQHEDK